MKNEQNEKISFLKRYKDEIRLVMTVFIFVISLIGSWQYYIYYSDVQFPSTFRFLVALFQSTISLFLANASVSIGKPTPFLYELARFLAPLLTSYCIYKAIQENLLQYIGRLRYHFQHDRQIIIFGSNAQSIQLAEFLAERNKQNWSRTILLVTDRSMSGEEKLKLEKKDIHIRTADYFIEEENEAHSLRKNLLSKLHLDQTEEIVFFEEDSVSFALFCELLELQQDSTHPIRCAVCIGSESIANAATEIYNSYVSAHKTAVSLILFDTAELEAIDLVRHHPFHEPVIRAMEKDTVSSLSEIPAPHIVIAGCGTCGMAVLGMIMKTGILNLKSSASENSRTTVTVIDRNAQVKERILKQYPRIDEVLDLNFIHGDAGDNNVVLALENQPRITYAALCFSSQKTSYQLLSTLRRYLGASKERYSDGLTVPIGIRMEENSTFLHYFQQTKGSGVDTLFAFGTADAIASPDSILRNNVEQLAMEFNYEYEKMASRLHGYDFDETRTKEDLWNALTYIRKRSNRAVVMNIPYYREAIRLLHDDLSIAQQLKNKEVSVATLLKQIEGTTTEQLVQLEHLRWCNFYYSAGYVGACKERKDKDQFRVHTENGTTRFGRVHNCLVSYDELKNNQDAETIYYDLINIIMSSEEGEKYAKRIRC